MRSRTLLLLLAICVPTVAFGQITSISPESIFTGPTEDALVVFGSNLVGTESTTITFTGPAGTFSELASAPEEGGGYVFASIPFPVATTQGTYAIDVYAKDVGVDARHYGPATFTVIERVITGPPLLSVPESVFAPATSTRGAEVTYTVEAFSQGGTGLTVGCSPVSGSFFAIGTTNVSCTATDSNGSAEASFPVVVADVTPPVFTSIPADITTANQLVTFTLSATDDIDGSNVNIACNPASGATFPFGETIVQCVATDQSVNPAYASFKVTVTGGPVLTVPADFFVETTNPGGTVVHYTATATNGATVTCSPASGTVFPVGPTIVECTATNAVGSASASFRVNVILGTDTTPPVLSLPANIVAEATSAAGATVTYVATAHDAVDGSVPVTCNPPSGSTFPIGTTTVACSAQDAAGNPAFGTFTVTVRDTTAPVVSSLTATPNTLWPPDHKMVNVALSVVATDAIDPNPVSMIVSVSSNQPINGTGDGDAAPDWNITGPLTLQLRSERAGNADRVYTITVKTTDSSGNFVLTTVEVRVTQQNRARALR